MSIEDGACLAECISRASNREDIRKYIDLFEKIRKPRVSLISNFGDKRSTEWASKDATVVKNRDKNLGADWKASKIWDGQHFDSLPDSANDDLWGPWVMAHDVVPYVSTLRCREAY